ncbi:alpha/beta hydrolase [Sphingomonas sp.]|uniref:alpha/beta hydrolase n=1 Tax=Sphingomonas sp. TaxID=28214 RepID=UPI00333F334F
MAQRMEGRSQVASVPGKVDIAYGTDPLQHIDFWRAKGPDAPLVIFIHGGGWKRGDKSNAIGAAKISHYLAAGYAFASVNYRLVPAATVEQQAQDVADAVATLRGQSAKLGFDASRIVLMGHSAGAHLAALVGTDPRYFAKAGMKPDAVRGVILLDGAAYDVPRQIAEGGNFMHDTYVQAFGDDPTRQKALSPAFQVAAPNAPDFLILHIAREDGTVQSTALGAALRAAGTPAEVAAVEGKGLRGHMEINRKLGEPDYPATALVDAYLKQRFAR